MICLAFVACVLVVISSRLKKIQTKRYLSCKEVACFFGVVVCIRVYPEINVWMNFIFYNLFIPCPFKNSLRNICKLLVYSCYSIGFTFEFNSVLVELQKKLVFISWCRYLGMVVVICVLTRNLQKFFYVVVYLFKLVETLNTLKILSIFQLSWLYNVVACLVTSNPILKI